MKVYMKRFSLLLVSVCMLTISLCGCGGTDFSAYLKALLDNHYLNDSTAYVELELGTKEEAEIGHRNYVHSQVEQVSYFEGSSEELKNEYYVLLDETLSKVKYTVGEATEVDDTTVEVSVSYETMVLTSKGTEEIQNWLIEMMIALISEKGMDISNQELIDWSAKVMMELMREGVANAAYEEPKTMSFRIQKVDDVWTPNEDDFMMLDYNLFNYDQLLDDLESAFLAISDFDASEYMKAIFDTYFKGETDGFVAQGIGTAEEGLAIYNGNMDAQIDNLRSLGNLTEEIESRYRQMYVNLLGNYKYEVGEAVQLDDDTYEVQITYEKMYIMDKMTPSYRAGLITLSEQWTQQAKETGSAPSGDEVAQQMFGLQLDCMEAAMAQATYGEPMQYVIRIEWSAEEMLWVPDTEQFIEFEYCLMDYENALLSY